MDYLLSLGGEGRSARGLWASIYYVGGGCKFVLTMTILLTNYKRGGRADIVATHPIGAAVMRSESVVEGSFSNVMRTIRCIGLTFQIDKRVVGLPIVRNRGMGGKRLVTTVSPESVTLRCTTAGSTCRATTTRIRHGGHLLSHRTVSIRRCRVDLTGCRGTGSRCRLSIGGVHSAGLATPFSNSVRGHLIRGCRHIGSNRNVIRLIGARGLHVGFAVPSTCLCLLHAGSPHFLMRFSAFGKRIFRTGLRRCLSVSASKAKVPIDVAVSSPSFSQSLCTIGPKFAYDVHFATSMKPLMRSD